MARPLDLDVRGVVLATLAPCLVAASLVSGWITYRTLYDLILAGFEARLVTVSTVTGSFIDGSEHQALLEARYLVGLTGVPDHRYLVGLDTVRDEVVAVDRVQGGARGLAPTSADSLRGLTVEGGRLVSRHLRRGWVEVDTVTGALRSLPAPIRLTEPLLEGVPEPLRDLTRDPRSGEIRILAGDPPTLFAWRSGRPQILGVVRVNPEARPVPALDGLAFEEDGTLYAAGERLVELGAHDGVVGDRAYVQGFRSEGHPTYQRYVRPMRRIARAEGLTYVYTQVADRSGAIRYVLDATEGPGHSFIGDPDSLPLSEIESTLGVQTDGDVYVTGLKRWETWGFLKSAYAPIVDDTGRPVAMAGADVDISSISRRTRSALARVVLLCATVLALGALVSLWVARRLTRPLATLKDGALRLAAGDLGAQVPVSGPTEVRRLGIAFNSMSRTLRARIGALEEQGRTLEEARLRSTLDRELGDRAAEAACPALSVLRPNGALDASGAAPAGDGGVVVWLSGSTHSPDSALRLRATMHRLASRLSGEVHREVNLLDPLAADGVHTLAFLGPDGRTSIRTTRPDAVRHGPDSGPLSRTTGCEILELPAATCVELVARGDEGAYGFRAVVGDGDRGGGAP